MKQTTISKKQENKGFRGIIDATSVLSQVLKQFSGIYGQKLADTDGLTIEQYMEHMGVPRFVTPRGVKKGYTPGLINNAWNDNMLLMSDEGGVFGNCIFKNVPAKYTMTGEDNKEKSYRVYASEKDALSATGKPISKYQLVEVQKNKWSVRIVLTGLKQSKYYDKEAEKAEKSAESWEAIEECWIVVEKGEKREAHKIDKNSVVF